MRINVYACEKPVRIRKFVKNVMEAQSFCDWYRRTHGVEASFVICR